MGGQQAAAQPAKTGDWKPKDILLAFGHLAVLSSFALAQPLFNLLSDNPEFFAARGSTASEIIVFAVLLVVVPPTIMIALEIAVGFVSGRLRQALHLVFIAGTVAVIFVQALKKAITASDAVLIALALAIGIACALLYARAEPVRSFLSVLTPAPIVFLVLFLFISPVHKLTLQGEASAKTVSGGSNAPVVMLGLDEIPITSLLDADGKIDAKRYPGFAELAADSTWFPNAHSIYDSTSKAWPAIMDGNYPEKGTLPTSADHPNSIFALLGNTHVMNVSEEATTVCPRSLCKDERLDEPFVDRLRSLADDLGLVYKHVVAPPDMERRLASVSETWGDFGGDGGSEKKTDSSKSAADTGPNTRENLEGNRNKRLDQWIESIKPTRKPALNFKHVLLPHVPWQYLPDGRQYQRTAAEPIPGISRQSYKDPGQRDVLQLRHLLQAGFVDRELRKLIRRLKETGLYDDALVVVTADHGVSFKVGQFDRRDVNRSNIDEISPVPLFIKRPGQTKGVVDPAVVETTDIFPTIADVLHIKLPDEVDGKSAFSREVRARKEVKMLKRDLSGWIRLGEPEMERRRRELRQAKARLFGTGADGPDRIYRIGPHQELIGRAATSTGRSQSRASIVAEGEYERVDPTGTTMPIWVTGRVSGGSGSPKDIAIAVNGTVRGVGRTFRLATGGGEIFGVLVPPSSLRRGRNRVQVFEVAAGDRLLAMS
jgi:hypothetical protein